MESATALTDADCDAAADEDGGPARHAEVAADAEGDSDMDADDVWADIRATAAEAEAEVDNDAHKYDATSGADADAEVDAEVDTEVDAPENVVVAADADAAGDVNATDVEADAAEIAGLLPGSEEKVSRRSA